MTQPENVSQPMGERCAIPVRGVGLGSVAGVDLPVVSPPAVMLTRVESVRLRKPRVGGQQDLPSGGQGEVPADGQLVTERAGGQNAPSA